MSQAPLKNAEHFTDLCAHDQKLVLDYIDDNLKMIQNINHDQSAYGLKARLNRLTAGNKSHHITSRCFMEAMVTCGFKAVPVKESTEPNWHFNVGKTHFTD